jgi:putative ABC transport system permease protein
MIGFLRTLGDRTPLGWLQLRHERSRLLVAMAGITFADVLIFMQLGFMGALFESSVLLHRQLAANAVILSANARNWQYSGSFTRRRLLQAEDVTGVADTQALYVALTDLQNPISHEDSTMMLLGMDPDHPAFTMPALLAQRDRLKLPDTLLVDEGSRGEFQSAIAQVRQGKVLTTEIDRRTVTFSGLIRVGASFQSDGVLMTSDQTFLQLFPRRQAGVVNIGLVRFEPNADPVQTLNNLKAHLPKDVQVMSVDDFVAFEQNFLRGRSPISFVFTLGSLMGFIVGVVIVYQILSTDVNDHRGEYATFKAMGYQHRYLLGVIFEQALILSVLGFLPGLGISLGLYNLTRMATSLPIVMPVGRTILVFVLTVVMCNVSGAIASRKLQLADPADMF